MFFLDRTNCMRSRRGWGEDNMRQAIIEVLSGKMGYNLAARHYDVPRTTLFRMCSTARKSLNTSKSKLENE